MAVIILCRGKLECLSLLVTSALPANIRQGRKHQRATNTTAYYYATGLITFVKSFIEPAQS